MKTIEYKVSFEKMISRLPGLFAYLERDDFGVVSLHKATDSLDGCWGKIVQNIKLPKSLVVDGETILNANETYTFRTIIDYYYQYKNELDKEDEFKKFVETGIGKIEVPKDIRNNETPEFLYLSNVKSLYNKLVKMDKMCEFYNENLENKLTDKDKELCCLCEKYEQMGGDNFKNYVKTLIPLAESIAEEYKNYAQNMMTLDFDIDLVSTNEDLGIMTPYAPIWLPYKKYKKGDKVEYNGELYVCINENNGKWSDDYLTVLFDDENFEKVTSGIKVFNDDGEVQEEFQPIQNKGITDSKLVDLRRFVTYYNDDNVAEQPEVGEDWLFYYRKGIVFNIRSINDNLGNIAKLDKLKTSGEIEPSKSATNLAAYGDVIEYITYDTDNFKIKFTYRIGVHLNADDVPTIVYDDDNNEIIKWKKFVWDNDNEIGIKYEEEYNYEEGSDLDKLIQNNFVLSDVTENFTFDNYIIGKYDNKIPTYKFKFITINNTFDYNKTIAHQDVNIVSLLTNFEKYRQDFDEFANYQTFREDYLNGISYNPTKNIDVHIERGITSVFEKHISFGEIKTMEDMIEHAGKTFKMTNA